MSASVFKGNPSLMDQESIPTPNGTQLDLLPMRQVSAFREGYSASCLDHDEDNEPRPKVAQPSVAQPIVAQPSVTQQRYNDHRDEIIRNVNETHRKLRTQIAELTKDNKKLKKEHDSAFELADANVEARLKKQAQKHEEILKLVCSDRDVKRTEVDGLRVKMTSLIKASLTPARTCACSRSRLLHGRSRCECDAACSRCEQEQSQSKSAHDKLTNQFMKHKKQTDSQNELSNSATQRLTCEKKELQERLELQKEAHRRAVAELTRAHARELERSIETEKNRTGALRDALTTKDRLLNQLAENNDRKDGELEKSTDELRASRCAIGALLHALRDAEDELGSRTRCARAVACETDTIATSTHECAMTQTPEHERLLPEDLPNSVSVLAKLGDAVRLTAGTCSGSEPRPKPWYNKSPVNEDVTSTSTGATNGQFAYQEFGRETQLASFHAMNALSAVQWLVQWTQGCEQQQQHQQQLRFAQANYQTFGNCFVNYDNWNQEYTHQVRHR